MTQMHMMNADKHKVFSNEKIMFNHKNQRYQRSNVLIAG